MKRKVTVTLVIVALIAAVVLFMHPVKVLSNESYRYQVFFTLTTTDVDSFAPLAGGWRAYLDDENYIWFSDGEYVPQPEGTPFGIKWGFPWQQPILNMGVS